MCLSQLTTFEFEKEYVMKMQYSMIKLCFVLSLHKFSNPNFPQPELITSHSTTGTSKWIYLSIDLLRLCFIPSTVAQWQS